MYARFDDEDDDPRALASAGAFKVPDRDYYRKNFSAFPSVNTMLSLQCRPATQAFRDAAMPQPHFNSLADIVTPYGNLYNPADGICCHFLRRGQTKPNKVGFHCATWSPDSRWLVLGTQHGDLALWEGEGLKVYKLISVPAHKDFHRDGSVKEKYGITAMAWKRHGNLMVTGDERGVLQFCDEAFRTTGLIEDAHKQKAVRGLSFSPLDTKLASCR
jgi:WD40 repeat protein